MKVLQLISFFTLSGAAMTGSLFAASAEALLKPTGEETALTGRAIFEDSSEGLRVSVEIENAPPGEHGFHIHQYGSCADHGKAAGDHYNPADKPHGSIMEAGIEGAHAGDFGNITVDEDGKARLDLVVPGLTVSEAFPVAGRALILHEKADRFTQPAGDAGGRIGCGTIYIVKDAA